MKVLVVCTGNICRSPMGEIVLAAASAEHGMTLEVDSAGISDEEHGNSVDPRARRVLEAAGYRVPRRAARQVRHGELGDYDLVLAMTSRHQAALLRRAAAEGVDVGHIRLWREFDPAAPKLAEGARPADLDVADPWYGGHQDFLDALDMVEAAVDGILAELGSRAQICAYAKASRI